MARSGDGVTHERMTEIGFTWLDISLRKPNQSYSVCYETRKCNPSPRVFIKKKNISIM